MVSYYEFYDAGEESWGEWLGRQVDAKFVRIGHCILKYEIEEQRSDMLKRLSEANVDGPYEMAHNKTFIDAPITADPEEDFRMSRLFAEAVAASWKARVRHAFGFDPAVFIVNEYQVAIKEHEITEERVVPTIRIWEEKQAWVREVIGAMALPDHVYWEERKEPESKSLSNGLFSLADVLEFLRTPMCDPAKRDLMCKLYGVSE